MEFKDYYKVMGLKRDASADEIRRAYRKLARKYHPDVSKEADAEKHFKDLGEAYEVLSDPEKRAAYDQLGNNWQAGQDFRPPPGWQYSSSHQGTEQDFAADDFFESLFGRGRRGGFHAQGTDRHARIQIDLEDAYHGANRAVSLDMPSLDANGNVVSRTQKINITIPRGIYAGQHMRLAGQGGAGMGDGKSGDLYLEISFRPHPLYRVEQRDVYLQLPIAPWEAALGATVKVPTPDGTVDLKIPPNFSHGRKLRLKGRGIPAKAPGDFYAVVEVVQPPADSATDKAFYETMARRFSDFNPRSKLGV